MRFSFIATFIIIGLSACATKNTEFEEQEPINLVGDDDRINQYWEIKNSVNPSYPIDAARNRLSGCVEFEVTIDSNGKASQMNVIKSFPKHVFNKKGRLAMQKWKWEATEANAKKTPVITTVRLDFWVEGSINLDEAYSACQVPDNTVSV